MITTAINWFKNPSITRIKFIIEVFIFINLGFLALDIWVAHSVNEFHHKAEWIPFFVSIISPLILAVGLIKGEKSIGSSTWKHTGNFIGAVSLITGILGLYYHLESQFFQVKTISSLVYTAPFVAPLAYSGLGFLLLANRSKTIKDFDLSRWVILFAFLGWVGNFILSLADHAQNGFHNPIEWLSVFSSALAVGFLYVSLPRSVTDTTIKWSIGIQLFQFFIGSLGFVLHLKANLEGTSNIWDNFVYGAPIFAPLLFANLALLAIIGLWGRISIRS